MGRRRTSPDTFWTRVNIQDVDTCWVWKGARDKDGYGVASIGHISVRAHRLAWTFTNGDIPDGSIIRHTCHNPPCCNPAHLAAGTTADNVRDKMIAGRHANGSNPPKGEKSPHAKLTQKDVDYIRQVYVPRVVTLKTLANKFNVSVANVSAIIRGKKWRATA